MSSSERDYGFVIYRYSNSYRYAVVSNRSGRIDATIFESCSVGAYISYIPHKQHFGAPLLKEIQLITIPLALARHDIGFLHHIFELCFYFVPIAHPADELFELLQFLYTVDNDVWTLERKKIVLIKLLVSFGYYPEIAAYDEAWLTKWRITSINELIQEAISTQEIKKMDHWLKLCLAEHPHIMKFKTTNFLNT